MNFRTELHPKPAPYQLNLTSKVVTVGSCFSDVIGGQLEKYKVETLTNPFGTLFNPLSACKLLQICAGADVELAESFVENNGRWFSYDFHSSFSGATEEDLYEKLDEAIVITRRFLKKADVLVLTLGTANVFRLNITGETVANCHKLPAANFTRETLLPEEIITAVAETHSLLRQLNPNLKLVLTVSPVRHLKDTLELNSVSKAVLRLATHFLTESLPDCAYFPAYELLIDDLRDYRFYQEDLLHPTPLAEKYIWEKFTGTYFEEAFRSFTAEWDTILRGMAHKPFHPESAQHQAFIQNMLEKLRTLQANVNVTGELAWFESQVIVLPEPEAETDEEETEEAEVEEDTIPGYFNEEIAAEEALVEAETDEEELVVADLLNPEVTAENPETQEITETAEARKRKKKQRRKKKKSGQATAETSLSEVATAAPSETPEPLEQPSEPAAELAEILADPTHPIAHYGETLSEAPVKKPLSKSAKRRESRRRKKNLEALQQAGFPQMPEEATPQEEMFVQEETMIAAETGQLPDTSFSSENATVSEERAPEIPPFAAETPGALPAANIPDENAIAAEATSAPLPSMPEKPVRGRGKKKAFPELFVAPSAETQGRETVPETTSEAPAIEKTTENQSALAEIPAVESPEATVAPKPAKGRGRKPKTPALFAAQEETHAVPETIAVPFMPASELELTGTIAVPFMPASALEPTENPEKAKKPAPKRARPAKAKASETKVPEMPAENVASPLETSPEKPAKAPRKPASRTKNPAAKPAGRKKKTLPKA
ncbi:GSCFA domain-containing protein [Adhaeribacter sp. BT258]|uniref:GSCFA domain-containing protein n=1 Tax=Adhaeribacter terrigena TaxID=2793070 RepID=A0ABS1BYS4_9BACT|nr:GSCFA domain-containing protein [Adhaeribacter terrigena]MBK0402296.1 GSCFA domain-containing protein [Adhaeribacter terrigena]